MVKIDFRELVLYSSFGYACNRLILDEKGNPADFEFLDVNSAFETLTGLSKEEVLGKKITQLDSGLNNDTFNWVAFYGDAVIKGESREFEQYSDHLKRWYRIQVIPQDNLVFVALFTDITELKESKERLLQYMHNAPDSIFISDNHGRYISVNHAACRLLGYTEAELLTMTIKDIVPHNAADRAVSAFRNLVETGTHRSEIRLLKKNGDRVWVVMDAVSLHDGNYMAFCKNISERKKAESELKDFALFNKTLLETIPAPIFYKDTECRYLGINHAFTEFYGKTEEEMIGRSVYETAPHDLAGIYEKADRELLSNPGVQVYESQVLDSGNTRHDVIFHKATFSDTDGNTGGIIGVLLDITERKKAEKELELYFKAIQSIDQPLMITDRSGNIIRVNNAFIRMYGYSEKELHGKNPRILNPGRDVYMNFGYTDEEYDRMFTSLWKEISSPGFGTWENTLINRKKNGTLIWVKLVINAVYDEEHTPVNYIGLPVDISSSLQQEAKTKIELYRTIAALAELRDNETGNHMRRVGFFAKLLAREYGKTEKYCNDIEIFAPLHDIGKVGISDSLLLAGRKLAPDEFEVMKSHTLLGHNIVKGKKELDMVAEITLNHHEWYDGTGYPNGTAGKAIPLSARITAIADVYDALRSRRPYKDEWSHEDAKRYIITGSGRQFDPVIVSLFEKTGDRFESIYRELKD